MLSSLPKKGQKSGLKENTDAVPISQTTVVELLLS